jgi:hypothetical protein
MNASASDRPPMESSDWSSSVKEIWVSGAVAPRAPPPVPGDLRHGLAFPYLLDVLLVTLREKLPKVETKPARLPRWKAAGGRGVR